MDARSCPYRSLTSLLIVFLVLVNVEKQNVLADSSSDDDALLCATDLSSFLPLPYSNLRNMVCKRLWNSFMLRYSHAEGNLITIVLSTAYTSGWVGMGFSRDGMMLNSSCMVGWITPEGRSRIKQYYIEGFTPSEIKPDKGELPLTSVPPYLAVEGASIYLAFQLKFATPINRQPILLAYSSKYPQHHHLTIHDDKTTIYLDFSSGHSTDSSSTSTADYGFGSMKKTHGVLSLLGWGLFLPCGAILARYLRHKEPLWYYLHVTIQFIGFILGVAAIVVGLSLDHRLHAHITAHKTLGIFVLVFAILQVCLLTLAFLTQLNANQPRNHVKVA